MISVVYGGIGNRISNIVNAIHDCGTTDNITVRWSDWHFDCKWHDIFQDAGLNIVYCSDKSGAWHDVNNIHAARISKPFIESLKPSTQVQNLMSDIPEDCVGVHIRMHHSWGRESDYARWISAVEHLSEYENVFLATDSHILADRLSSKVIVNQVPRYEDDGKVAEGFNIVREKAHCVGAVADWMTLFKCKKIYYNEEESTFHRIQRNIMGIPSEKLTNNFCLDEDRSYKHSTKPKKIVSFSLYGENPFYHDGAIKAVNSGLKKYPDWEFRFYLGDSIPKSIEDELKSKGCKTIRMEGLPEDEMSMFWRFYACEDGDVTIFRDADSPILWREKHAVNEWLSSDKALHVMRDHKWHDVKILGGMWGIKGRNKKIKQAIENYFRQGRIGSERGADQDFLCNVLWPDYNKKESIMLHVGNEQAILNDEFWSVFPTDRIENEFVGMPYNWPDFSPEQIERCLSY